MTMNVAHPIHSQLRAKTTYIVSLGLPSHSFLLQDLEQCHVKIQYNDCAPQFIVNGH